MNLFDHNGRSAVISECGLYRYRLARFAGPGFGSVNFIMCNPSTADATKDDPTIRRCVGFARKWGYTELVVTNLWAYRSTDPDALRKAADPVGPENDRYILEAAASSVLIVCAWGSIVNVRDRVGDVLRMLADAGCNVFALRVNADGQPAHPLYLPADLTPVPFNLAPRARK